MTATLIQDWTKELPALTAHLGIMHPVYLDNESLKALEYDPIMCQQANWLVHIGKHVNKKPPSVEKEKVDVLIAKLKLAIAAYNELAPNNQARISNFEGSKILNNLLAQAQQCEQEPLPKKSKLENLYYAFENVKLTKGKKSLSRSETPTQFQMFMAVVIRLVDGDLKHSVDHYLEAVTKHYKRVVKGQ